MTTNNRSVGRSSVRAGISAIGICRAPSSRQTSSSFASRTSRTVCSFPALRTSASSRTEIASDPLRGSVDLARLLPDLLYCRTYVGLKAGQGTFRRKPPSNLEPFVARQELAYRKRTMPPAAKTTRGPELTLEERRERRQLRREKQREDNVHRAAKMHAARLEMEATSLRATAKLKASLYVGCSGWRYWDWRGLLLCRGAATRLVQALSEALRYRRNQRIVLSWPTVANVQAWQRGLGKKRFVYTVKVCELITHVKKFKGTKILIKDFGMIADVLGDRMGCFLFQLPPSYSYTKARLNDIVSQLDPARRNVVEFRHATWWNEEVYSAFRKAGIIFCSCSAPRLPGELIRTIDEVYVRLHGPKRWYRHDYSDEELAHWAIKIKDSGANRAWVYFNNDFDAHAPKNAVGFRRILHRARRLRKN